MRILKFAVDLRTRTIVRFAFGLAVMALVGAVLHETFVFGVASHLRQVDIDALTEKIHALPYDTDVVHTHLVLSTLTAVRPRGIAVAGPPGEWLHSIFPSLFLNPAHVVPGTVISAVLSRGSSLPARFGTRVIVELLLIALGSLCIRAGIRAGHGRYFLQHPRIALSWLEAFGLFLQAQATWAVIRMTPTAPELDYMGIGVIVDDFLPGNTGEYNGMVDQVLPAAITLFVIGVGFSIVPVLGWMGRAIEHAWTAFRSRRAGTNWESEKVQPLAAMRQPLLAGFLMMLALAAVLPTNLLAQTNHRYTQPNGTARAAEKAGLPTKPSPVSEVVTSASTTAPTPLPSALPAALASATALYPATSLTATPLSSLTTEYTATTPAATPSATALPSIAITHNRTPTFMPVTVERSTEEPHVIRIHWSPARAHFVLTDAKGELVMLRGVNYNTHYTALPQEEHVRILRRDLGQMRAAGVNLITGYATFNEVTLEVAQEYGIFVIMPYVLDLNGDYLDPKYREQVKAEFTAFIRRYENYTSLVMWNFDDEPVHNMQERFQRPPEQVQAFADLLFELSEHAYETDRYHRPSWLKEPRDWYLDIFANSINRARQEAQDAAAEGREIPDPNRYVVLARSAYGTPLDINEWLPKLDAKVEGELRMPFAIGEYGVVGMGAEDRGLHLAEIWGEAHDNSVLGSAVYTYGPFQPDPDDPTPPDIAAQLMLVDENGTPVDDAWGKLSQLWLAQQAEETANGRHSSIPVAAPAFQNLYDRFGGYPSSGPIKDNRLVRQFFVEGKQAGRAIAYVLEWDGSTEPATFKATDEVVFEELGDYRLTGEWLEKYMERGGYAQFGAPISNPHDVKQNGRVYTTQDFVKGWTFVQDRLKP